jgi:branched-chain amino acid transport system permease protein
MLVAAAAYAGWRTLPVRGSRHRIVPWLGGACAAGATALVLVFWRPIHAFVADMGIVLPAFGIAFVVLAVVGYVFERLIVRPVYGDPLKQILVTVGAAIVILELLQALWGPGQLNMPRPETLQGGFSSGGVSVEKYRIFAVVIGLAIYWAVKRIIHGTKVGLLIRAGVENVEMVEAHGYRIRLLFVAVFVAGAALAGVGGVMWGLFQESATVALGGEMLVTIIIVIIIGGLGSITGCFYAALMVELLNNYMAYIQPDAALFSAIGLMVLVLLWRPQGLQPAERIGRTDP